jgi:hypothetical protein
MKMKKLFPLVLGMMWMWSSLSAAHASGGFETGGIILYQTDTVLRARVPDVHVLADYTKSIEAACHEYFTKETKPAPPFHVVLAVKPGNVARVWFVTADARESARLDALKKKLEALPAMEVSEGPVVFAITEAETTKVEGYKSDGPPLPAEWQEVAKKTKEKLQVPDGILPIVWPDTEEQKVATKATIVEYVEQILEPLGGKISKPKAWHYSEGHAGGKFMWTISEQDISGGGSYDTGVRIQAFFKVKENTGKSAKEFLHGFIESKKNGEAKVLSTCPEKEQGMFTRTCLEVEEGKFRILYSIFWTEEDGLDAGVVMISGAPKEQWARYASTFNRMAEFQLLDMKRLEKDAAEEEKKEAKEKKEK